MKKIFFLFITLLVLQSCGDKTTVTFKYHHVGRTNKYIGEFDRGLTIGDTTGYEAHGTQYQIVLDSLIPEK